MNFYCCDFETLTEEPTRVWAWSKVELFEPDTTFEYGNSIDSFMENVSHETSIIYFRNLKFDGEFIMIWLFEHGYGWTEERNMETYEFKTLISDRGQFYSIKFKTPEGKIIELRDSLKVIPLSISETAEAFGLEETKLTIDYHKYRPDGYELEPDEIEYIKNDVVIDAKALQYFYRQKLDKLTIGGNAMKSLHDFLPKKRFKQLYPVLDFDVDGEIRKTYKGGYVYTNPAHKNKVVENGVVGDINSHFPYQLHEQKLPYGLPVYFKGEPPKDTCYPLYTVHIQAQFYLKPGKLPTIQMKNSLYFKPNEYLENSDGEVVDIWLTSLDLELFLEHYEVPVLRFIDGYMFRAGKSKAIAKYIDYWMGVKEEATRTGNKGLRTLAKLMLNNIYGKFGLNPRVAHKIPHYDYGMIKYTVSDEEVRDSVYVSVATFVTAYARCYTIRCSQKVRDYSLAKYGVDMYLYSDTDSIHTLLPEEDFRELFNCHPTELGRWDIESNFKRAKFVRSKCYIEEIYNKKNGSYKMKPTVAGLPKKMHSLVTIENLKEGQTYEMKDGKKRFKHVKGGIILVDVPFTIK